MIYLLVICLMLLTFFTFNTTRDVFHPAVVICGSYTFSAFVAALSQSYLGIDIQFQTVVVIMLFLLAFSIPCMLLRRKNNTSNYDLLRIIIIPQQIKFIFLLFVLIITILYVRYTFKAAILGGLKNGYENLFTYAQNTLYSENSELNIGGFLNYGIKFSKAISYILTVEVVQNFFYKRKNSMYSFFIISLYLVQCLFSTGRTKLFYFAIFVVSLIVLYWRQKSGWNLKDNKRVVLSLMTVSVFALIVFRIIGVYLRGSIYGNSNTVWESLSTYIGGPIYSLDVFLKNITHSSYFGEETLYSFYGIFSKFGIKVSNRFSFLEFIKYGKNVIVNNNVYGAIRRYIHDYGYFSIVIVIFEGIFFSNMYEKIKKYGVSNFIYIFYSSSLFAIVFFFFEERMLIDVFSTSNALIVFVMYIIYKRFSYINNTSDIQTVKKNRKRVRIIFGRRG